MITYSAVPCTALSVMVLLSVCMSTLLVYHVPDCAGEDDGGIADPLRQFFVHARLFRRSVKVAVVVGDGVVLRRPGVTVAPC